MREPAFLRQNKDKWREYEQILFSDQVKEVSPDRLAALYVQLTDDLAYARTFYPKSSTVSYLNGLAARTHLAIYKNKKVRKNRYLHFWVEELPLILYETRKEMLYAFLIFIGSFLIGLLSSTMDQDFIYEIMGHSYVEMTKENIAAGKPLGVYEKTDSVPMFVMIAVNNVKVSFMVFAFGIIFTVGSIWLLFQNGVMVGAFLGFFLTQNLVAEALPIIFIHGTLELSAIVIAGGAGFALGNSILFPGTLPRVLSIQRGALRGVKMIIGLIPVFVIAALLESFITRLFEMPLPLKLLIILVSLAFIIGYYIVLPRRIYKSLHA